MVKIVEKFTIDNSPLIMTGMGAAGSITTAILAGKASFKANDVIREADETSLRLDGHLLTNKEKLKLVLPLYIPVVGSGVLTVTCIIVANRVGTKRAAAMAAAYTIAEKGFEDYREKIIDKFGINKEREARDEIAQDRVRKDPVSTKEVIITGGGEVLCYDNYTGRYFNSSVETIKQAQNNLNHRIINHMYASLNDYYDMVGLDRVETGEEVGWNSDELLEITFSTTMSDDQKPCISISFYVKPVRNYFRTH